MSNEKQCENSSSCGRESCEGCPSAQGAHKPEDLRAHLNQVSSVKKMSGKLLR